MRREYSKRLLKRLKEILATVKSKTVFFYLLMDFRSVSTLKVVVVERQRTSDDAHHHSFDDKFWELRMTFKKSYMLRPICV